MLRLYLLRHFKSAWDDGAEIDAERGLAPRGERAGRRMAEHMRRARVHPDLVLVSPARRAVESLALVRAALPRHVEVRVDERVYGADAGGLLAVLRDLPATCRAVLMVGHNPGIQELALVLARPAKAAARIREGFPTGALATLDLPQGAWKDLSPGGADVVACVVPREL